MTHVYDCSSDSMKESVTIIARDSAEAFRIFFVWRETNVPHLATASVQLRELNEQELAQQRDIARAALGGIIGVAWWIDHERGWIIVAPDSDPVGHLAPPSVVVRCFRFSGDEEFGDVHVFAEAEDEAITMYQRYIVEMTGEESEYSERCEIKREALIGPLESLQEDMDQGFKGIACECDDGMWRVFPADYEAPVKRRDGRD